MTQQELIAKFSDLSNGFSIDERVNLDDIGSLFSSIDEKIRKISSTGTQTTLADVFPENFPFGNQIGMDYLEFTPKTDSSPSILLFSLSWENASWEIIEDVLTIEGFDLQFSIVGQNVSVQIDGFANLEDYEISLGLNLPALFIKGQLTNNNTDNQPSPAGLLNKFKALPSSSFQQRNDGISLKNLTVLANPKSRSLFFNLELDKLTIGPVDMTGQLQLNYSGGAVTGNIWTLLEIHKTSRSVIIGLSGAHSGPGAGWQMEGGLATPDLKLSEIIKYIADKFGVEKADTGFPEAITLDFIYVTVDTQTEQFTFQIQFEYEDAWKSVVNLSFELNKLADGYEIVLSGELIFGEADNQRIFDLVFDKRKSENIVLAEYRKPGGEKIGLQTLLNGVIPSDLASSLPSLSFKVNDALLVMMTTANGTGKKVNKFLFTSDIELGVNLSKLGELPLVGSQFSGKEALTLAFQPIISSKATKAFQDTEIADITQILPTEGATLPDSLGTGGMGLIARLQWGSLNKTLYLVGMTPNKVDSKLPEENAVPEQATTPDNPKPAESQPEWTDIKKNFGAVNISKVGLSYDSSANAIKVLLDGGLKLGPLELALAGLSASYDLTNKALSVDLEGMGISFQQPPLEISGAFLKMINPHTNETDYVGKVTLQMETFGMGALGAFSEYNGKPSFFLYAFINYPLGGPAFFFVEGLSVGFGYNRRLEVPPIVELRSFPLIAEVIGETSPPPVADAPLNSGDSSGKKSLIETLRTEFESLENYIYPQEGQYFIAAGLKFSSFKTLESFALLTIGFGRKLDFAIMGVTKLSVPAEVEEPVAQVEMAFSVRFDPAEGFVAVNAILTPNSYILSGLCKLEGGFAFYSWFKGPHGGDFVVTLGGYHPNFSVPSHYPQPIEVPRLSFTWHLNKNIFIKGAAYYALSPKAMMLGGRLEAHYSNQSSNQEEEDEDAGSLTIEASFVATADFLIFWKPFHYEASASVEISASISVDTFLGTFSADISAGADLQIWGPPFAGTAEIHAKVVGIKVKFTIDFGEDTKIPSKISWEEFKKEFLPENPEKTAISIGIQNGLVQTFKNGEHDQFVINPKLFQLAITSLAPLNPDNNLFIDPVLGSSSQSMLPNGQILLRQTPKALDSSMQIIVKNEAGSPIFDSTKPNQDKFKIIPIKKLYPKALWTDQPSSGSTPSINGDQVISLTGGFLLVPLKPPHSSESHVLAVSQLEFNVEPSIQRTSPSALTIDGKNKGKMNKDDLISTSTQRAKLINKLGFDTATDVEVSLSLVDNFVFNPQKVTLN